MRIAIGSDHAGLTLKQNLVAYLRELGHDVEDKGTHAAEPAVDYPDAVEPVAQAILAKQVDRGIVVCGSGVGAKFTNEERHLRRLGKVKALEQKYKS